MLPYLVGGQPLGPGSEADLVVDGVHEVSLRCRTGGPRERIVAPMTAVKPWDAIIVGAGHNGLVAATLLARAGYDVLALERGAQAGGAAVSASPFPGVDVRLSRYSYLVSLFPQALLAELGVTVPMRRRRVSSYTPHGDAGVLICDDTRRTRESFQRTLGGDVGEAQMQTLYAMTERLAGPVFASLTEPLRDREAFAAELVTDRRAWQALFERPLSELLEPAISDDLVRGIVATDALIGTFAPMDDLQLRQNRCFLSPDRQRQRALGRPGGRHGRAQRCVDRRRPERRRVRAHQRRSDRRAGESRWGHRGLRRRN